ncbi:hypothetical protein D3C78_809290 [compost metagenome]
MTGPYRVSERQRISARAARVACRPAGVQVERRRTCDQYDLAESYAQCHRLSCLERAIVSAIAGARYRRRRRVVVRAVDSHCHCLCVRRSSVVCALHRVSQHQGLADSEIVERLYAGVEVPAQVVRVATVSRQAGSRCCTQHAQQLCVRQAKPCSSACCNHSCD